MPREGMEPPFNSGRHDIAFSWSWQSWLDKECQR